MSVLGFGFYSRVLQTASGWIVRLARTPEAGERHLRECRLLPALATHLAVAIPKPVVALKACPEAAFGGIAYRALPGRLMTADDTRSAGWEIVAGNLGAELARLHEAQLPQEMRAEVPRFRFEDFLELRSVVAPELSQRLEPWEWGRVDRWWDDFLSDASLLDWEPVLTHGDVWWGNLLVDSGRLSAILDWEFLSYADPAWELGTAMQFGEAFHEELVAEYLRHGVLDPGWKHRAARWWALRVFFGVRFAVERDDEEEWEHSLRKLREGPIFGG